jgi:hypothetical protein
MADADASKASAPKGRVGSNPTPGTRGRGMRRAVGSSSRRTRVPPLRRQAGTPTSRRESLLVPIELIALPPVAFALWLLACAPGCLDRLAVRERIGVVTGAAILLGPLALALLGVFGWLLLLAILTVAMTVFAAAGGTDRLRRRENDRGHLAVHEP